MSIMSNAAIETFQASEHEATKTGKTIETDDGKITGQTIGCIRPKHEETNCWDLRQQKQKGCHSQVISFRQVKMFFKKVEMRSCSDSSVSKEKIVRTTEAFLRSMK